MTRISLFTILRSSLFLLGVMKLLFSSGDAFLGLVVLRFLQRLIAAVLAVALLLTARIAKFGRDLFSFTRPSAA